MTPREPDRYTNAEWQRAARILDACLNGSHEHDEGGLVLAAESWRPIAAALRAAESSALERAARIARRYSHHAEREIRALIPPAAAPEAETRNDPCQRCGKLGGHPVDFRFDGILMGSWICPHCLAAQEKRIAELERCVTAGLRLAKYRYPHWQTAGGHPECVHGINLGIHCARCDLITLETGAARAAPPEGEGKP